MALYSAVHSFREAHLRLSVHNSPSSPNYNHSKKMKGLAGSPEVVEVVMFVKDHQGADQRVNLGGLRQPVRFDDISQRLVGLGEERVASL